MMSEYELKGRSNGYCFPIDRRVARSLSDRGVGDPRSENGGRQGRRPAGLGFVITLIGGLGGLTLATLAYNGGAGLMLAVLVHFAATPLIALMVGAMVIYRPHRRLLHMRSSAPGLRPIYRQTASRGAPSRLR